MTEPERNTDRNAGDKSSDGESVTNIYAPPQADLVRKSMPEIPDTIRGKIINCCVVALIHMVAKWLTVLIAGGMTYGPSFSNWIFWIFLLDTITRVALTYGVYRNNFASAVALFIYFAYIEIWPFLMLDVTKSVYALLILLLGWFYAQGIVGTWQYKRLMNA